mgnify:CR=1 FL=1
MALNRASNSLYIIKLNLKKAQKNLKYICKLAMVSGFQDIKQNASSESSACIKSYVQVTNILRKALIKRVIYQNEQILHVFSPFLFTFSYCLYHLGCERAQHQLLYS